MFIFPKKEKLWRYVQIQRWQVYIWNFCKKTNGENLYIKCIEGYYLSNDKLSCTKDVNCEIGDSKKG